MIHPHVFIYPPGVNKFKNRIKNKKKSVFKS